MIEVGETTLARDRGDKQRAYARGGVRIRWIVNLVDRRLEVHSRPSTEGYRDRLVLTASSCVPVSIGDRGVGQITVAAFLPPGGPAPGTCSRMKRREAR